MAVPVSVITAASIDQRFTQLIQQFGLTKNRFAISLGKTASVVQHLIDGRNKPGFDLMCKVFEVYPNVSRDWLLLGRGPMLVGSNGSVVSPAVVSAPAISEPDFEPIDLADVAPRAARRPSVSRLHPEEIAATLALATVVADGTVVASAQAIPSSKFVVNETKIPETSAAVPAPVARPLSDNQAEMPTMLSVSGAISQRPARPFRAVPSPAGRQTGGPVVAPEAAAAPPRVLVPEIPTPAPLAAPVNSTPGALLSSPQPIASVMNSPEAYVAAAMHAQHLQHQLALAEQRNQHLLEQQQMLREMLAMARQSMV